MKVKILINYCLIIFFTLLSPTILFADIIEPKEFKEDANQILFLMQAGHAETAIENYQRYSRKLGRHDFELLQQMGLILLDQGYRSKNLEIQILTLFGAGVSANEKALYILEDSLNSSNPQLQLVGMNFLARMQNDNADDLLKRAMGSNYLLIRLEAAYLLAAKKSPIAVGQLESLMCKIDPELASLFPQLFALIGDTPSIRILKRLLAHHDENVRMEAILSAAEFERDDLLPQIRTLATQHGFPQQEACAIALGELKDESSVSRLETLSRSSSPFVRLASLQSLYRLGRKEVKGEIETLAKSEDIYAIAALGEISGSEPLLVSLLKSNNINVRINAALALLERRDPKCLKALCEILIKDSRDLVFIKSTSSSKGLYAWKVIPSARQNLSENPVAFELSLHMREETLSKALDLPEKEFLTLASLIFELQQNDLVPTLVGLLENLQTPAATELLKKYLQKAGAPLIRNYCNLALYRMKMEGPYGDNLRLWVTKQRDEDLIRFRTYVPWEMREKEGAYQLTPQETSKLLVDSFDAFLRTQDDKGINIVLEAIKNGNPNNRYALAGLLIHATQ